jgi:hypothetical protein
MQRSIQVLVDRIHVHLFLSQKKFDRTRQTIVTCQVKWSPINFKKTPPTDAIVASTSLRSSSGRHSFSFFVCNARYRIV